MPMKSQKIQNHPRSTVGSAGPGRWPYATTATRTAYLECGDGGWVPPQFFSMREGALRTLKGCNLPCVCNAILFTLAW
jgi:hypothetical protein